jgi:probable rRNA maturation factor
LPINIILEDGLDENSFLPSEDLLITAAKIALQEKNNSSEISIKIVNSDTIKKLNHTYRKKDKTTNVLAFPMINDNEDNEFNNYLGDIAICQQVVNHEAETAEISYNQHWSHILIHATLHLQGYDHQNDSEADIMEQKEIELMLKLGYPSPYK